MTEKSLISLRSKVSGFVFFGNYFYGVCAVALSIEALLQQNYLLNAPLYFLLVFIGTVLYYTIPYVRKCSFISSNPRTNWYTRNFNLVRNTQTVLTIILAIFSFVFLLSRYERILSMPLREWLIVAAFPFIAFLYYGNNSLPSDYNLRKIGWLKPFIIGFIWAGLVTIYPVLFYCIVNSIPYKISLVGSLLFLKNLMFVSVLCIMFDIKDYATDYIHRLKTFVVGVGLRKTIFNILFPMTTAGLVAFIMYASLHGFHPMKILLNVLPFVLLLMVATGLRKRRTIMYYLIIVDGLMLVKALCGIVAISFFN